MLTALSKDLGLCYNAGLILIPKGLNQPGQQQATSEGVFSTLGDSDGCQLSSYVFKGRDRKCS
jgi:hypothetical protein